MATSLKATIQRALQTLQAERKKLDQQIAALQGVLAVTDGRKPNRVTTTAPKRRGISAKARRAASVRMKTYWAKRRAAQGAKGAAK